MVRLIPQGIAKHLTDTGELILSIQTQNHAKKPVELGALHALTKNKNVLGQQFLVLCNSQVHITPQGM